MAHGRGGWTKRWCTEGDKNAPRKQQHTEDLIELQKRQRDRCQNDQPDKDERNDRRALSKIQLTDTP